MSSPGTAGATRSDIERMDRRVALGFLTLTAALAAVVLVAGAALYLRAANQERERLATVIARLLAPGLESVKAAGTFRLQHLAAQMRRQNPEIAFIRVVDAEGVLVEEGDQPDDLAAGDALALTRTASESVAVREGTLRGERVTEIAHRLQGGYQGAWVGAVRLGLRGDALARSTSQAAALVAALLLMMLVLSWPFARWLGGKLGGPVRTLARDFAGVMEHAPLLVALGESGGRIDRASSSFLRAFGVRLEDGPQIHDILAPEVLEKLNSDPELRVTLGGEERVLHLTRFPVLIGPDGEVLRRGLIGTDLTAWRRDRDERDRLAAAVESAEDALLVAEPGRGAVYANPAFYRQTGLVREQVIGAQPAALLSGDEESAGKLAAMAPSAPWRGRIVARRREGGPWQCDLLVSPILEKDGRLRAQVWIARDVTRETTLETQLRQSQKLEAVGQLAGGVAHDFNNLLTVVVSATELLEQEPMSEEARGNVEMVGEAARRASDLTRQLLAFSRRQRLDIREVRLEAVVAGALALLRRVIGATIELHFNPPAGLWPVRGDVGQFEQVLMNLAINARDAMPNGGRLTVCIENAELEGTPAADGSVVPAGQYVVLTVADNGCGMTREVLGRVFEPFFTTKPGGRGTGLGLATVLGIVKQCGGYVWAYSEPGEGTVFRLAFPRADSGAADASLPEARPAEAGRGESILLVEDEPLVRSVIEAMLRRGGYRVTAACDGVEALEAMGRGLAPQLVLTDLVMPRMGGLELGRRLREKHPGLPLLFMSGFSSEAVELDALLSQFELVWKPPSGPVLLAAIRRALSRAA
jgi:PAS domain S-box-containing protein